MSNKKKNKKQKGDDTGRVEIAEPAETEAQDAPAETGEQQLDEADALRKEIEEWKDKFLRAKAEQNNAVRRAANEAEDSVRFANTRLLKSLLDVVDDFDRSVEAAAAIEGGEAVVDGFRLVREKLDKFLTDHGVEPIVAEGEVFDPARHEALLQQPSADHEPGTVIQQALRGYTLRDRVLRPAKVVVAAAPPEQQESHESADDAEAPE